MQKMEDFIPWRGVSPSVRLRENAVLLKGYRSECISSQPKGIIVSITLEREARQDVHSPDF
jgi:hypothetical protein